MTTQEECFVVSKNCVCVTKECCVLMSMTYTEIEHFNVLDLRMPKVVLSLSRDHSCEFK